MTRTQYSSKIWGGNVPQYSNFNVDGVSQFNAGFFGGAIDYNFNGSSWDRKYNNTQGTLLASAPRTGQTISPTQTNYNAKGIWVTLEITVASGTGGLKLQIRGYSPLNSSYWMNAISSPITTTGVYGFLIYPGVTSTSPAVTQVTNGILPRSWAVEIGVGDSSSYTYSVGYSLIL